MTHASLFPFSSARLSLWLFSFAWHPMARYWATSGWTRLSICVLFDGSISSPCAANCASAVSAALCWLVNARYTIKSHRARQRGGGRGLSVTHSGAPRLHSVRQKARFYWVLPWSIIPDPLSLSAERHALRIHLVWKIVFILFIKFIFLGSKATVLNKNLQHTSVMKHHFNVNIIVLIKIFNNNKWSRHFLDFVFLDLFKTCLGVFCLCLSESSFFFYNLVCSDCRKNRKRWTLVSTVVRDSIVAYDR